MLRLIFVGEMNTTEQPYARLVDENLTYAAWAIEYGPRFLNPDWLADAALMCVPASVKAMFERKTGDGMELKVYIGPAKPEFAEFYAAGAVELPLPLPLARAQAPTQAQAQATESGLVLAVAELDAFTGRLADGPYRHATGTPLPENGPVPMSYRCIARGTAVPEFFVTALSSGFTDAVARSEWHVCTTGAYASMSFFLQLMHRRTELVGYKIDACMALERATVAARTRTSARFHGPVPTSSTTTMHCGSQLGFLCARYRAGSEELVLHLSQLEMDKMYQTFPVLRDALSINARPATSAPSEPCFYNISFQTLQCGKSDGWVGRVQLETFIASRPPSVLPSFLLLHATYVDL